MCHKLSQGNDYAHMEGYIYGLPKSEQCIVLPPEEWGWVTWK